MNVRPILLSAFLLLSLVIRAQDKSSGLAINIGYPFTIRKKKNIIDNSRTLFFLEAKFQRKMTKRGGYNAGLYTDYGLYKTDKDSQIPNNYGNIKIRCMPRFSLWHEFKLSDKQYIDTGIGPVFFFDLDIYTKRVETAYQKTGIYTGGFGFYSYCNYCYIINETKQIGLMFEADYITTGVHFRIGLSYKFIFNQKEI